MGEISTIGLDIAKSVFQVHGVDQRTMLSNAIRGHLAELGIISAKGRNGTAELLKVIANAADDRIPPVAQLCLEVLARQYKTMTAEIAAVDTVRRTIGRTSCSTWLANLSPGTI